MRKPIFSRTTGFLASRASDRDGGLRSSSWWACSRCSTSSGSPTSRGKKAWTSSRTPEWPWTRWQGSFAWPGTSRRNFDTDPSTDLAAAGDGDSCCGGRQPGHLWDLDGSCNPTTGACAANSSQIYLYSPDGTHHERKVSSFTTSPTSGVGAPAAYTCGGTSLRRTSKNPLRPRRNQA